MNRKRQTRSEKSDNNTTETNSSDDNENDVADGFLVPPSGNESIVSSVAYKGPIPPAEMLAAFDKVIPNGADRIMKMAENQQAHEIQERTYINRIISKVVLRSQLLPFVLLMTMIGCGVFLIQQELIVFGTIVISPALILALVSAWTSMTRRSAQR